MKDLVIITMGHHSCEMIEIVDRINQKRKTWNLLGFINADLKNTKDEMYGYPILGSLSDLNRFPNSYITSDAFWSREFWDFGLKIPLERLATLIDPSSFVSRTAKIGKGSVIYPHCFVGLDANIGNFVFCLTGSVLNHHNVIEDMVFIGSGVTLAGRVQVGEKSYLGQASTVRQWVKIGKGSIIGMGSVVVKDVPSGVVMAGNPARKLRDST